MSRRPIHLLEVSLARCARFAAALVLCVACAASAKEICVAPNGNDDNAGTEDKPLATADRAMNLAQPDDTISFREGEYPQRNFIHVNKPGLTLRSFPKEHAVISAGNAETDPTAVIIVTADRVSLVGLEVRGGGYYGIKIDVDDNKTSTNDVVVRNCRVLDSGRDCVKIFNADRFLIEGCDIGPSGKRDPSNAEGIDCVGSKGITVRNCHVHDTATNGIYLKGGATDGIVENCFVENTGDFAGILLGQDTDLGFMRDGVDQEAIDCIARNNIIVHCGAAGIGTYSGSGIRFENNTMIDVAGKSQAAVWIVTNGRNVPARDVTVKNNIIQMNSGRPFVMVHELAGSLDCDFNVYYNASGKNEFWRETGGNHGKFDSWAFDRWQKEMLADHNSALADPLLDKDQAYRPRAGSPVVDRGDTIEEVKKDCVGTSRPQGHGYDIGAYEGIPR
jgi:hypothetical protein